jgi:hypothetical protein
MFEAFPDIEFGDQLKLEFFEGSDHVFISEKDRARLYDIVLNWMTTKVSAPSSNHESPRQNKLIRNPPATPRSGF